MHKKNNFDGLRLLGASLVLISHEFPLSGREEPRIVGAITVGDLGLMLFFSISGYLITQSWIGDSSLQRFATRRFLRIWPGLAAFVVVSSVVLAAATGDVATSVRMLGNLFPWRILDARAFHDNPIHFTNGSLWSIPLEITCYAAFAAVAVLAGVALRYVLGFSVLLAATYGMLFGVAVQTGRIPSGPLYLPLLASFFFAGSSLAFWRLTNTAVAAAFVLAAISLWALHNATLAVMLIVPVTTALVGNQSWWLVRDAGRYGDFSYGFYLWAWPMQQVAIAYLGVETHVVVLLAVSAAAALAIAFASWHLVESPALRMKPRKPQSQLALPEVAPAARS